jgi:hypothetical protein
MAEKNIYQDDHVLITTSKVSLGGSTYFLRNIASVRVTMNANGLAWLLLTTGLMTAVIASAWLPDTWYLVLLGAIFAYGAFKMGFRIYALHFDTASGSVQAYTGQPKRLFMLKEQIERAIADASS